MAQGYSLINTPRGWVAEFRLDADDCEAVASILPSSDGWATELLEAAEKMRAYEADR